MPLYAVYLDGPDGFVYTVMKSPCLATAKQAMKLIEKYGKGWCAYLYKEETLKEGKECSMLWDISISQNGIRREYNGDSETILYGFRVK